LSGKVFRPSKAFRNKLWVQSIVGALSIWIGVVAFWSIVSAFGIWSTKPGESIPVVFDPLVWFIPLNVTLVLLNLAWLVPTLFLIPYYVSRIEYSVIAESGESLQDHTKTCSFPDNHQH
jgi:hypothetical protein